MSSWYFADKWQYPKLLQSWKHLPQASVVRRDLESHVSSLRQYFVFAVNAAEMNLERLPNPPALSKAGSALPVPLLC